MSKQTEAQRLALALTSTRRWHELTDDDCDKAAAELLQLEVRNAELLEALKKISAIELQMYGPDWAEIQSAQDVANEAIKKHGGAA